MSEGELGAIVAVTLISGITIYNVIALFVPQQFNTTPRNKFDIIDEELQRLHNDADDYSDAPEWMVKEISMLNRALVNEKDQV